MEIHAYQKWEDYSGVILIDNLGLSSQQIDALMSLEYRESISIVSQLNLVEEVIFQFHSQGLFQENGTVILPGRGALRVWADFVSLVSELGLSLDNWKVVRIGAKRVIQNRTPVVEIDSLEDLCIESDCQWFSLMDDVVSSGATIQTVREQIDQPSRLLSIVIAPVINLGRNESTVRCFDQVYTGLAVKGCKGRNRVPIASFLGFIEREGWAERFGEKYARRPDEFVRFWKPVAKNA